MSKKTLTIAILILACALGYLLFYKPTPKASTEETLIRETVTAFSQKIKLVSLIGTNDQILSSITENYGPFISEGLLAGWKMEPMSAPGVSNKLSIPSELKILSIEKDEDGAYEVQGQIREFDVINNAKETLNYPIAMKMRLLNGKWTITGFSKQFPVQQ